MDQDPKVFIKDLDPDWKQTMTLDEWVIHMIETKKTKEPEFQAALRFYGREKFEAIWKAYQEKKKANGSIQA